MVKKKIKRNDGKVSKEISAEKGKMPSRIKRMTIRYDDKQEKEIQEMMKKMGEKTMSKAFLATPAYLEQAEKRILEIEQQNHIYYEKIEKLESVVMSWREFNQKLEEFVKKRR